MKQVKKDMRKLARANKEADLIYTKKLNKLDIPICEILIILIMGVCLILAICLTP